MSAMTVRQAEQEIADVLRETLGLPRINGGWCTDTTTNPPGMLTRLRMYKPAHWQRNLPAVDRALRALPGVTEVEVTGQEMDSDTLVIKVSRKVA